MVRALAESGDARTRDKAILWFGDPIGAGTEPRTTLPVEEWSITSNVWEGSITWNVRAVSLEEEWGRQTLAEALDEREAVYMTDQDYTQEGDVGQTGTGSASSLVVLLEEAAHDGDAEMFAKLADALNWSAHPPDELTRAIDLALSLDLASQAIELAQQAGHLFPDHERSQLAAQVLAPPTVRDVHPPRARGLDLSMSWLREHGSQYRGQWVAVREGKLLANASSLKELKETISEDEDAISTLITKVL